MAEIGLHVIRPARGTAAHSEKGAFDTRIGFDPQEA
jgi:hypothetical protein